MTTQNKDTHIHPEIKTPEDLRKLPVEALPGVAEDLRKAIISSLSTNPGHFASSMGAVDLTVALHYVFDTPNDRLVWDVGHQAYAHKMLTGRADRFDSLRTYGGLSGFPNPGESEYDTFIAGHASNSISAALGMAVADRLEGNTKRTVAIIGDAAISGGLAFEGLNNLSNNPNDLLVILNDNDMSIDDNVGALHRYLTTMTTSKSYNNFRYKVYERLKRTGMINESGRGRVLRFNNSLKALISGGQNIFEGLNIRYFGPIDGHDIPKLVKVLEEIKDMKGPRLLHLRTTKGKGFPEAERNPAQWHAPGKFNPVTGERPKSAAGLPKWQDVFGQELVKLAKEDKDIVGITAAMPSGTSMSLMLEAIPQRTFDVGISEGHAVTFAGGLAAAGKKPFVAIYSSFLQRAYDNIIHDTAIQGLNVTYCIDRAGIVGEDGVTHHGMFDLCYLRCIPGMTVGVPADVVTLRSMMLTAAEGHGPFAIRYPRGRVPAEDVTPPKPLEIGKGRRIIDNQDATTAILTIGPTLTDALNASEVLKDKGINVAVYDMIWLKPLDTELLKEITSLHRNLITVEDGAVTGGFGTAVSEYLTANRLTNKLTPLGAPDKWITHGTVAELKQLCGYDADSIARAAEGFENN